VPLQNLPDAIPATGGEGKCPGGGGSQMMHHPGCVNVTSKYICKYIKIPLGVLFMFYVACVCGIYVCMCKTHVYECLNAGVQVRVCVCQDSSVQAHTRTNERLESRKRKGKYKCLCGKCILGFFNGT
jgi:hypothetical protein